MLEFYIAVLASLFSVVNPIGAIPVFLALTPTHTKEERRTTAVKTAVYFALLLIAFFLAGTVILTFFGISLSAMRIAGGLVILASGYGLLYGKMADSRAVSVPVKNEAMEKEDISFSPMAMPMLSGPGSISLLIGYFDEYAELEQRLIVIGVIATLALIVYLILLSSPALFKLLGLGGLQALTRIMGFIVMAIGVQYIILGVIQLANEVMAAN
ncbi:MAG: MarC family NAAT transporter [Saprospiraceae bacterium]